MNKRDWTKEYNSLPFETRKIANRVFVEMHINQLKREKSRLKRRYNQSLKEINEHIKNLEREL